LRTYEVVIPEKSLEMSGTGHKVARSSMKTRPVLKCTRRSEWECVIETPRHYRDKAEMCLELAPSIPRGTHFFGGRRAVASDRVGEDDPQPLAAPVPE
jgi:hypothetical protein